MAARGAPIGNQNSVIENRRWKNTLNRAIAQDKSKRLRLAAEVLLDKAAAGEPWAVKELGDRLDGKPAQQLIHSGDGEAPLSIEIVRFGENKTP